METIKVTELRNNLPAYLKRVKKGEELLVTSRGKVIARLVPIEDARLSAREQLARLRGTCRIGDVVSPIAEKWEAVT